MSKASAHYLVVNPALTPLAEAQRLNPAQHAHYTAMLEGYEDYYLVPYTQKMQRLLRAARKQGLDYYYSFISSHFNIKA